MSEGVLSALQQKAILPRDSLRQCRSGLIVHPRHDGLPFADGLWRNHWFIGALPSLTKLPVHQRVGRAVFGGLAL